MASSAPDIRLARIRRLRDSELYFGSVLQQTDTVLFVRMTTPDNIDVGDKFMFELKGSPDMLFVAKVLGQVAYGDLADDKGGRTFRFSLLSDVLPIGAL